MSSGKERTAALRKKVGKDPYDAQAWESLVSEADRVRRGPERNAQLSEVYEDLLNVFPTAVRPLPAVQPAAALPPSRRHCCRLLRLLLLRRLGTGESMQTTR